MTDKPSQPEIHHPQAPKFNDRHMVVARTTTEKLYVHLTRDEALERGQEAAGKRSQARALGEKLAAHNKRVRADIKALENRAEHLERQCELEAELADVECDVIFDYQANEARTVRRDTGQLQVKETRSLQKHEIEHFQLNMETGLKSVPNSPEEPAKVLPFDKAHDESEAWAALHSEPWDTGTPEYLEDDNDEPEDSACSARPLRERIVEVLTVEDVFLTFTDLMHELALDSDDERVALEVDNELAAGLRCTPQVYARDEEGRWGLFGWVKPTSLADGTRPSLRDAILDILRSKGEKGITNRQLVSVLRGDIHGNDSSVLTLCVDDELATLKADGLARGRKGPGKRWYIVEGE